MFEVIESINDVGRRVYTVRNTERNKDLGTFRFYDDAIAKVRALEGARMRRLRDTNMRKHGPAT